MVRTTWNATAQSYTVSRNGVNSIRVINIPCKSQAVAVAMDLRNGWVPSFGTVAA